MCHNYIHAYSFSLLGSKGDSGVASRDPSPQHTLVMMDSTIVRETTSSLHLPQQRGENCEPTVAYIVGFSLALPEYRSQLDFAPRYTSNIVFQVSLSSAMQVNPLPPRNNSPFAIYTAHPSQNILSLAHRRTKLCSGRPLYAPNISKGDERKPGLAKSSRRNKYGEQPDLYKQAIIAHLRFPISRFLGCFVWQPHFHHAAKKEESPVVDTDSSGFDTSE